MVRRMVRLTVLYPTPGDQEAFISHYAGTHIPLVKELEKLESVTWGKTLPGPDGSPAPYFVATELRWASPDDMAADFGSPKGAEVMADVANLQVEPTMFMAEGNQ